MTDGGSRKQATCLSLRWEPVELAVRSSSFLLGKRHILIWMLTERTPICQSLAMPPALPSAAPAHVLRQCSCLQGQPVPSTSVDPRPQGDCPSWEGPGAPEHSSQISIRHSQFFRREQLAASPAWLPSLAELPVPSDP